MYIAVIYLSPFFNSDAPAPLPVTGKRYRRADTNIVSIKFSQLIAPSNMHTGDAVYCSSCNAVLSHLSKITQHDEDKVCMRNDDAVGTF